jgi:hypothetical protein
MYPIAFDETRCDADRQARCDWLRKDLYDPHDPYEPPPPTRPDRWKRSNRRNQPLTDSQLRQGGGTGHLYSFHIPALC